jgi:hypothetical protein
LGATDAAFTRVSSADGAVRPDLMALELVGENDKVGAKS